MAAHLLPLVIAGLLVIYVVYRRFRRSFGRQQIRERRMTIRILILALVCVLALLPPYFRPDIVAAATAGALCGFGLGRFAISRTRFEASLHARFYTPHPYIGLSVSALFVGRLIYRLIETWPAMQAAHLGAGGAHSRAVQMAAYQHNPLTVGLYFLLAGYYISYYIAIIQAGRKLGTVEAGE